MTMINFSESEIKAGYLVQTPDWYDYVIKDHKEKPAKTDGSANHIFIFEGQNGEMSGVPVVKLYSSKVAAFMVPLFKAANGGKDLTPGAGIDPNDLVGITLQAYTKRGQNQEGSPINDLVDFRPKR